MTSFARQRLLTMSSEIASRAYSFTGSTHWHEEFDEFETLSGDPSKLTKRHIVDAIKLAKDDGLDVRPWLRARMLISTLASAAEAKHTGRQIADVWNSPEPEDGLKGAVEDGVYAGLPTDEIADFIGEALDRSEALLGQPNVQRAVQALAEALPVSGRLKGARAVSIINRALAAAE